MDRLKIRNFGPVLSGFSESSDGYFDINNVSIFIGNQGTGKSTVAKIYSTFAWLEKVLVQNRYEKADLAFEEFQDLCENQRIPKSYFTDETELGYKGNAYEFCVDGTKFNIHTNLENSNYICPKIMYVPSERNLLSVLEHPDQIKQLPQMVKDFSIGLKNAHLWLKSYSNLSFLGYDIKYNENEDVDYIKRKGDKLVVTTHSPYILSALNNYIYAKEIYSTLKKTIKEIPQGLFVDINEVSAYKLEDGKIHNIIDDECKLIDASAIDSCSSKINKIYSDLMELDGNG